MKARNTKQSAAHRRGFTLLELLIATLCFAIILTALNSTFYTGMRLRAKTVKYVENAIPYAHAQTVIRRDLQGIMTSYTTNSTYTNSLMCSTTGSGKGRSGQIVLYTTTGVVSDDTYWGDVQQVAYYLKMPVSRNASRGQDLIRGVNRNVWAVVTNEMDELILLGGVDSLDFSFYDGTNWINYWDSTVNDPPLPRMIRMSMQFTIEAGERVAPPPLELLVPVFVQARTNSSPGGSAPATAAGGGAAGGGGAPTGGGGAPTGGGGAPTGGGGGRGTRGG